MSRRVRRKVVRRGKEKVDCPETDENLSLDENGMLDWTRCWTSGPINVMLQLLQHLPPDVKIFRSSGSVVLNLLKQSKMTDATLSVLAARHEALESLVIGPDFCERISSDAVKAIAICCPKLRKLRISGLHEVDADAINALAKHCPNLTDIGFIDCRKVDETALGNVASLRFLSVAGTTNIKWNLVLQEWSKLPHLIALDVSKTDIKPYYCIKILFILC
ncbi:UNVERIFIED_CONTAM: protein ARABIDILLO 1 [Sesamum radiatum]|uniref:Protein ARABIDILLO 1 n=1 Tax=Sesamum radiatum TaxID=300843 RepID=A0AAW2VLY0_SESRA